MSITPERPIIQSDDYTPGNNVLVLPANLVAESTNGAVLAAGAESENTQSLGNDDALLLVVGGRNTLEDLESLQSSSTTRGLVGDHSADGLVEDAGGGTEVEGTTTSGVVTSHLAKVGVVLHYIIRSCDVSSLLPTSVKQSQHLQMSPRLGMSLLHPPLAPS